MAVTVYTLPDCIQCEMTKKLLNKHNITYSTIDMNNNNEAKQLVEQLGFKQAPVVVYDKFSWSGFRPDKINALHLFLLEKGIKKVEL